MATVTSRGIPDAVWPDMLAVVSTAVAGTAIGAVTLVLDVVMAGAVVADPGGVMAESELTVAPS